MGLRNPNLAFWRDCTMTERFRFSILAVAVVLLVSTAGETYAQSGTRQTAAPKRSVNTQNSLRQITGRANASRFGSSQFRNQVTNRTVPQYGYSNINRNLTNRLRQKPRPTKPFSGVTRGSSTTPYLGLSRPFGGVSDIYDVRRQANQRKLFQQQQRSNENQQRQNVALQSQLNQLAAQGPYSIQGSTTLAPTGHAAVFMNEGGYRMNLGGFYPR